MKQFALGGLQQRIRKTRHLRQQVLHKNSELLRLTRSHTHRGFSRATALCAHLCKMFLSFSGNGNLQIFKFKFKFNFKFKFKLTRKFKLKRRPRSSLLRSEAFEDASKIISQCRAPSCSFSFGLHWLSELVQLNRLFYCKHSAWPTPA